MTAHSETLRRSPRRLLRAAPRLNLVAAAVLTACTTGALANPSGATLVAGSASMTQSGSTLTITNTPGTILNWQSFSIAGGETTRFVQQDASSTVLNRVVGQDPSAILGSLASNGRVFLINPNGVLFGPDARIDVAGLVASTLNLSDQDFLANRLNFTGGGTAGVRNEGSIATTGGGSVYLLGGSVENSGRIQADGGSVTLAAGKTVRLGDTASPNVLVELDADSERVSNLGTVSAAGGEINIYAGVIDQRGFVHADSVGLDPAGRIRFFARHDIGLAAGSQTSASGAQGGEVRIDSATGSLMIEGAVRATGTTGNGGRIELTGEQVGVVGTARIDASGAAGGGEILLGGDYRGGNPDVHNARAVYLGADARLDANAVNGGDGGRIILWSDEATRAYGTISAHSGAEAGNGGFVETSSKGYLEVTRTADVSAANGLGGTWLLDPGNLTVQATAGNLDTATPNFIAVAGTSTVSNTVINAALDAGTSVVLDTGSAATGGAGNLSIVAPITKSTGALATLTLVADNDIVANASISDISGNGLNVSMTAARTTPTGTIRLFGGLNTGSGNFSASAPSVQFFNPGYSVGGSFNVSGNFSMGSNASLVLGNSFNAVGGNLLLDPNAGGSVAISSSAPGTQRTIQIGGALNLTDVAADGTGVVSLTDLILTGPSVLNIGATTITAPIVNLNNSRLNTQGFSMSGGTLQGTGGQLIVSGSFSHTAGTIDFGLSAGSLIKVQHTGSSLNLTQSLRATEVSVEAPDGSLTNAAGANAITATRVRLVSCTFINCSQGGIGTAANPLRLSNVSELLAEAGGSLAGDIYIDNAGTTTLQLGMNAFQSPGAIANNSPGGSVTIKSAGSITLPDYCPDGCFANVRTQGGAVNLISTGGAIDIPAGSVESIDTLDDASGSFGAISLTGASGIVLDRSFTNHATLTLSGTLSGTGSLVNNSALTLGNAAFGGTFDNNGSTTIGAGSATFDSVVNNGSIQVNSGASFTATSLAANSTSVINGSGGSVFVLGDYQQLGGSVTGSYNDLQLSSLGALSFGAGLTASGTLLLNSATTLSLTGSGASYSGGTVTLLANSIVVDSTTVSASNILDVAAASLSVAGTSAPAKLLATNALLITGGTVTVDGGSFGASIDPTLLDVSLSGDLTLTGGAGAGAPAELLGDSVSVTANIVTLANGGAGSGATIVASAGNLSMNYASCNGCTLLAAPPTTADTGMFGQTVTLNGVLVSGGPVFPATVSGEVSGIEQLIVGTNLAESGAIESEGVAAGGALDDDDDETDDANVNGGTPNEQQPSSGVPVCS